jgi:hypothetical protein
MYDLSRFETIWLQAVVSKLEFFVPESPDDIAGLRLAMEMEGIELE